MTYTDVSSAPADDAASPPDTQRATQAAPRWLHGWCVLTRDADLLALTEWLLPKSGLLLK